MNYYKLIQKKKLTSLTVIASCLLATTPIMLVTTSLAYADNQESGKGCSGDKGCSGEKKCSGEKGPEKDDHEKKACSGAKGCSGDKK